VAVAALALVEEGVLNLNEPIDELVPELASRSVLRSLDAELDDTVPARRRILLEDLLSYRLGFGSVMVSPGTYPIQRAEAELGLQSIGGPPWPPGTLNDDEWIAALGTLPLMYQPGERWLYNTSGQVLGVLVARACGQSLESVVQARIFDPLGMVDTGFTVPPEIQKPVGCRCSTRLRTVGGACHPRSPTAVGGSSRRSMTTGPLSPCCWRGAPETGSAYSRRIRSRA
jgi:CubicO group peptidase (beta-lactamase class C family)